MSHILFVTGKLAEPALRRTLADLAPQAGFEFSIAVLPITVAALMTTPWVARHLTVPPGIDRVLLPGWCAGDLSAVEAIAKVPVERGPKDLRDLPLFFGKASGPLPGYGAYDIAILAEINHAPRLSLDVLLAKAKALHDEGADLIDLGCDPGATWTTAGDAVEALREAGLRVSIDSFDPAEVEIAVKAGAELVLSVNTSNLTAARSWGCEVVAVPDVPATLEGLDRVVETLAGWGVPFRIDPVIEPIGFGFAASLGRYLDVRRRYPQAEMMMGVGNLTELTDADSAGINVMLLGFCQELGIRSVLTTEVINWCRSCVRELARARRLVHHAVTQRVLPKHLEPDLVMLRDPRLQEHGEAMLAELARRITDRNFRLFAERGLIHVINDKMFLQGDDPFALFEQMQQREKIDPAHAFYLGYEMAKAVTALTLGKNYVQDQALRWGFLTRGRKEPQRHRGHKDNRTLILLCVLCVFVVPFFRRADSWSFFMRCFAACIAFLLLVLPLAAAERPDILIADFEGDTYGDWKTTGTAFGTAPARGTLPGQMPVSGYLGKGLVNSFNGGDKSTGTLTSPAFEVERKYINFLIGGGKYPGKTCINLLIDNKVVSHRDWTQRQARRQRSARLGRVGRERFGRQASRHSDCG